MTTLKKTRMTENEIASQVQATLDLAENVAQVEAPAGLKAAVMQRIAQPAGMHKRAAWVRPAFAAAAAIAVLAVNALTISHFVQGRRADLAAANATETTDLSGIDGIRMEYSLTNSDI
jgi:hypothetical protein